MSQGAGVQPGRAQGEVGLSITDFLSDGGYVQLCATLAELLGAPVRLLDAQGRQIVANDDPVVTWRLADPGPDAATLAAERAFAVPMRAGGAVIGWVHVGKSPATEGPLAAQVEQAIALIVDVADQVCERELELRARLRELSAMQRLIALLASAQSEDEVLGIALDSALELLGLHAGSLVLFHEEASTLASQERDVEHRVSRNLSEGWLANPLPLSIDRQFDRQAMAGQIVAVSDLQRDPRVQLKERAKAEGLACALHAGMIYNGRPLGVIRLYGRHVRTFTQAEERVLRTIAHQASVAIGQARLLRLQRRERQTRRQLRLASDVQRRMLPKAPPRSDRLDLAASWEPSLELSGDFYDFIELDTGRAGGPRADHADRPAGAGRGAIGIVVGDVVGKGVAAALLMSHVRASLRAHASVLADPASVLAAVNDDLCRDSLPNEFVTLWYGVVDPQRLELMYASAGHDPPVLLRWPQDPTTDPADNPADHPADGPSGATPSQARAQRTERTEPQVQLLRSSGMLAGVLPGQRYGQSRVSLRPGDTLAIYTDGLTDARSFDGQRFGRQRLVESLRRVLAQRPDLPAASLVQEAIWDVRRFTGLAQRGDDQTLVVLRVGPPGDPPARPAGQAGDADRQPSD